MASETIISLISDLDLVVGLAAHSNHTYYSTLKIANSTNPWLGNYLLSKIKNDKNDTNVTGILFAVRAFKQDNSFKNQFVQGSIDAFEERIKMEYSSLLTAEAL